MTTEYNVDIQELDIVTRSGRVYPSDIMLEAIAKFKNEPCYGVIHDYPANKSIQNKLDLKLVSHKVTNLRIVDKMLIGDVEILKTPNGLILSKLFRYKKPVLFRLRSFVNYRETIADPLIVSDCEIVSIDAIINN